MRNINKTLNTVCLMLMISFIYIMIVSSVNNERMLMKPKEEKFQQISLFDIKCMIDEKKTFTLYVSREDCDYCKRVKPLIYKRSYQHENVLFFYSTSADRIYNKQYMDAVLDELYIESVPCIVYIRKGKVESRIEYEEIIRYYETN